MTRAARPLERVEGDEATLRGVDAVHAYPAYRSTLRRAPDRPFLLLPAALADTSGPVFGHSAVAAYEHDLTRQHDGEPLGERIIVSGKVVDRAGRPVRNALIEIWQANAAGRYIHAADRHPAPLDPNFTGAGRCMTGDDGSYRFVTIKPGAYPWGNHANAWRPAHIHLSLFGRAFTDRLVTQMYFPGDPLFEYDPIFRSVRDPQARERLISSFDLATSEPEWALAYRFDVVLGGAAATPIEDA